MKLFVSLSTATVLAAGLLLSATFQDKKPQEPKGPPAATEMAMPMPKPGPEHEMLKKGAGTWDAVIKMGDQEAKGVERAQMQMSGLWLVYQFSCDNFMGSKFEGAGATTWSPDEKTMYFADTLDAIYAYDFDAAQGRVSNRRIFGKLDTADGAKPNDAVDKLADQMDEVWMQLSADDRLYLNGRP